MITKDNYQSAIASTDFSKLPTNLQKGNDLMSDLIKFNWLPYNNNSVIKEVADAYFKSLDEFIHGKTHSKQTNNSIVEVSPVQDSSITNQEVFLSGIVKKKINIPEIKVRYNRGKTFGKAKHSKDVYALLKKIVGQSIELQEQFIVLYFDKALNLLGYYKHTIGTTQSVLVDIPLILGIALKALSTGIVIAHNHPTGNLTPSKPDIKITDDVRDAARILKISLLDHIIFTKNNQYYSFTDEGYALSGYNSFEKTSPLLLKKITQNLKRLKL